MQLCLKTTLGQVGFGESSIGQQNSAKLALVWATRSMFAAAHPHPKIPKVSPGHRITVAINVVQYQFIRTSLNDHLEKSKFSFLKILRHSGIPELRHRDTNILRDSSVYLRAKKIEFSITLISWELFRFKKQKHLSPRLYPSSASFYLNFCQCD